MDNYWDSFDCQIQSDELAECAMFEAMLELEREEHEEKDS